MNSASLALLAIALVSQPIGTARFFNIKLFNVLLYGKLFLLLASPSIDGVVVGTAPMFKPELLNNELDDGLLLLLTPLSV